MSWHPTSSGRAPDDREADLAEPPQPTLWARGLTVQTTRGTVVGPLDLTAHAGQLVIIEGPASSGRSSLLLALTGRMRGVSGDLAVAEGSAARPRSLQAVTSVARLGTIVDLDDPLTVGESVIERCLADGLPEREGSHRMTVLGDTLGFRVPREATVGELSMLTRVLFMTLLAQLRPAALTVLDDLDHDLSPQDQAVALNHLAAFAADTGTVIVVSTVAAPHVPSGGTLIRLSATAHTPGDIR